MKDNHRYAIEVSKIEMALEEFKNNNKGINIARIDNAKEIKIEITDGTRKGILHLYRKKGGNFSHSEQGGWIAIAENCWRHLLTKYGMQMEHCVLPSISNVEKVDFEAFLDCFKDTDDYQINNRTLPSGAEYNVEIVDKQEAKVILTYYGSKKMLIQGSVTKLLVDIVSESIDVIPQADKLLLDKILPPDLNGRALLDINIDAHIKNTEPFKGGKIEKMINTSLVLANSGIIVDDYSCFSTSILRALDAMINGKISQVDGPVLNYYDYFEGNSSCGYKMKESNNPFPDDTDLSQLLADAYTYYHNHRHPIAHTDHQNVETSCILTYEEAIMEIKDTLYLINKICEKW